MSKRAVSQMGISPIIVMMPEAETDTPVFRRSETGEPALIPSIASLASERRNCKPMAKSPYTKSRSLSPKTSDNAKKYGYCRTWSGCTDGLCCRAFVVVGVDRRDAIPARRFQRLPKSKPGPLSSDSVTSLGTYVRKFSGPGWNSAEEPR